MKYTIRKLAMLLVVGLLIASPALYSAYERATTKDPFILIAREIEAYPTPGVDVINVVVAPNDINELVVLLWIPDMPNWSTTENENLKRYILQVIRGTRYNKVAIGVGWNYTIKTMRIDGIWVCSELKTASCEWSTSTVRVSDEFLVWPGIGRP